jgi:methionyl-tRNA formyltransferase
MDNQNRHQLRIVFMGTPEFAVPSLDILHQNGFEIATVVTAPDKKAGRGLKMKMSAIKQYALEKGLKVLQPKNLKSRDFISKLTRINAELFVVVAFRILPEEIFTLPSKGTINLHASLLPDYRGAAPINRAIMNGEKVTGVTTFFIEKKVDTGNILLQDSVAIGDTETASELHDKLKMIGARLLLNTVKAIEEGSIVETEQRSTESSKTAPKIFTNQCQINFELPVDTAFDFIRALSPYPGAWFDFEGKRMKVFRTQKEHTDHGHSPGNILTDYKTYFKLAFADGLLAVEELQMEGKKKMPVEEFLKGMHEIY